MKWQQAYDFYGIEDGAMFENKKTKLRFANSKTKISKKKAHLETDVFGKIGWIEAVVVSISNHDSSQHFIFLTTRHVCNKCKSQPFGYSA